MTKHFYSNEKKKTKNFYGDIFKIMRENAQCHSKSAFIGKLYKFLKHYL